MQQWEYKRVRSIWNRKAQTWMIGDMTEQDLLKQLGEAGWEMIAFQDCIVSNLFGTPTEHWHSFMFKRPLEIH